MRYRVIPKLSDKMIERLSPEKMINNDYICETAGFIPLEVQFKRFEQAGIRAQVNASDYTSSDYREMYLNPDYQVYPDDEIEEMTDKFQALQAHIADVKKKAAVRAAAGSKASKSSAGASAAAAAETIQSTSVDTKGDDTSKE